MEQKSGTQKFLSSLTFSLPFWWIVLTAIYLILTFSGLGYAAGWLGLFVPIGAANFLFSLSTASGSQPWMITFPMVLLTIFGGEWLIRKLNLSPGVKFFVILGILFILTIAVDFVIWGQWQSLYFLEVGGEIKCC